MRQQEQQGDSSNSDEGYQYQQALAAKTTLAVRGLWGYSCFGGCGVRCDFTTSVRRAEGLPVRISYEARQLVEGVLAWDDLFREVAPDTFQGSSADPVVQLVIDAV